MRLRAILFLAFLPGLALAQTQSSPQPASSQIISDIKSGDFTDASQLATATGDPLMMKLVTFFQLLDPGGGTADEIQSFIATNPDATGPSPDGILPATGSVAALIERATGVSPYFIGKPNPLMMREALNSLGAHSETTVMVGDRMDTDIIAGIEAGLSTILVLSGVTDESDIDRFPFRPGRIVASVADLVDEVASGGSTPTS